MEYPKLINQLSEKRSSNKSCQIGSMELKKLLMVGKLKLQKRYIVVFILVGLIISNVACSLKKNKFDDFTITEEFTRNINSIYDEGIDHEKTIIGWWDFKWGFYDGLLPICKKNEDGSYKWGFVDKKGDVVIPLQYDFEIDFMSDCYQFDGFNDGLAKVGQNEKWGFIDKKGEIVVPIQYDEVGVFSEGLAAVSKDGKMGFVDKKGKVIIPLQYDDFSLSARFSEGLAAVRKDGKMGFVNKKGKVVIPLQYDNCGDFSGGLAVVDKNQSCGFIDKKGKVVIPMKYDNCNDFSEGLALISNGQTFYEDGEYIGGDANMGFIDTKGKSVIPLQYNECYNFKEGMAAVCSDGRWGFVDTKGNDVIPSRYEFCSSFSEGMAAVCWEGKWGFIDKKGNVVIPFNYDFCEDFSEGMAAVEKNEKWGFIDAEGNNVIPIKYDKVSAFCGGIACVEYSIDYNGQNEGTILGFVDKHGNTTLTDEYIRQKEEQIKIKIEKEQKEKKEKIKEWLQGTWECRFQDQIPVRVYNRIYYQTQTLTVRLVVNGDYITCCDEKGSVLDRGIISDIDLDNQCIYYGNNSHENFDYNSKTLFCDKNKGLCYKKINNRSQY